MIEIVGGGAIVGCYIAIILNMRWTMAKTEELKNTMMTEVRHVAHSVESLAITMQKHHEDATIHAHTDNLVTNQLCEARIGRIEDGQKNLLDMMDKALKNLDKAIDKKQDA